MNGISSVFNPLSDKGLKTNYSIENFDKKVENKLYLQEIMGLPIDKNKFVIGMVTRIVEQKGFDLILNSFDDLLSNNQNIQFVLLGTGDEKYIKECVSNNEVGEIPDLMQIISWIEEVQFNISKQIWEETFFNNVIRPAIESITEAVLETASDEEIQEEEDVN